MPLFLETPIWAKVPFQSSIFSKTLLAPAGGRHRLLIHSCRSTLEAVSRFSGFASWYGQVRQKWRIEVDWSGVRNPVFPWNCPIPLHLTWRLHYHLIHLGGMCEAAFPAMLPLWFHWFHRFQSRRPSIKDLASGSTSLWLQWWNLQELQSLLIFGAQDDHQNWHRSNSQSCKVPSIINGQREGPFLALSLHNVHSREEGSEVWRIWTY